MSVLSDGLGSISLKYPVLRRYTAILREDLSATYSRDIQKWLLVGVDADVAEALRMLGRENNQRILFVTNADGKIAGIVTGGDILLSLQPRDAASRPLKRWKETE